MIKYYCVHHEPAKDRYKSMREFESAQQITLYFVCSAPPDAKWIKEHKSVQTIHAANQRQLSVNELSCYYKHLDSIREGMCDTDFSVILEDDIQNPDFNINELVEFCVKEMKERKIAIVYIGSALGLGLKDGPMRVQSNDSTQSRCAHAYIVNNDLINADFFKEMYDIILPLDHQLDNVCKKLNMKTGWSYPHIYQKTQLGMEKSLLR